MIALDRDFYDRAPERVAKDLLGRILVRESEDGLTAGRIVETEAYLARNDPGSHSYVKKTKKNASMFGPPGHAYVYSIHAKWCFNVVTEPESVGSAVLIRAVEPLQGIELMKARRARENPLDLARGPARLCQAFAIDRSQDAHDLTTGEILYISSEGHVPVPRSKLARSTRIGLSNGADLRLRFFVSDSRFVSGPRMIQSRY